jgi:hypothetical protein
VGGDPRHITVPCPLDLAAVRAASYTTTAPTVVATANLAVATVARQNAGVSEQLPVRLEGPQGHICYGR